MKTIESFISKANDINITVKGEQVTIISKQEVIDFILDVHGKQYVNRSQAKKLTKLSYLGGVNVSSKIEKGSLLEYSTYVMYLAPYKGLFGNVCAQGEHCYKPCLNTSGRVKMDVNEYKILRARHFRTMLFYVNREYFNRWLFDEIKSAKKNSSSKFMVRLNGTSDLSPSLFVVNSLNVLEAFPDVQFYDYTKIFSRIKLMSKYSNYHITFSFNGYNMDECRKAQALGINVSIVIDGPMPAMFMGRRVFSMDTTDLRPLDELRGAFGYLKLKKTLNAEYDGKFVIKLNQLN
jgi:hypothetical protein